MNATDQLRDSDKRAALHEVLSSATFSSSSSSSGAPASPSARDPPAPTPSRGATLHEYLIGVEALGRPTAYSTEDDSSVRRRAYAMRQKLQEVYAKELTDARVRIEVPKGGYVPRFTVVQIDGPAEEGECLHSAVA